MQDNIDNLKTITAEQLQEYILTYFTRSNLNFIASGDINIETLKDLVESFSLSLKSSVIKNTHFEYFVFIYLKYSTKALANYLMLV